MRYHTVKSLALLLAAIIGSLLCACSNSEGLDCANHAEEIAAVNEVSSSRNILKAQETSSSSKELDYLPLDDSEYPYAGIPRIVIETENHREIKDRETEIPAKLQIWGENAPESEVMDLTIRGRGNTSWTDMPKKSYKIEFINKQSMLGMPKDRDWALIANYADKTLMKNYLAYNLSTKLGAYYAPRCEFVELYLNKEYLGVYLLTETIKIAKHRINIPENDNSYVVEIDARLREGDQIAHSHILRDDSRFHFQIHSPKDASQQSLESIENYIQAFETYLANIHNKKSNHVAQWIDIDEYVKHYWVQEFSKNPDADFKTSVYFSWIKNDIIKMGPIWDFDVAFGGYIGERVTSFKYWYIKDAYWNKYLFQDSILKHAVLDYWKTKGPVFSSTLNVIDSIQNVLQQSVINNFKRWDILQSTEFKFHSHSFQTYKDATDYLKNWIKKRIAWIDEELSKD